MSIAAKRNLASAIFVALLLLSVFWPAPVVAINDFCCHAPLRVDALSFLGREALSWDVVYWCLAGLFGIALLQQARDFAAVREEFRAIPFRATRSIALLAAVAGAAVALIWLWADAPVTAWAERISSSGVEDWIRIANRFGGGYNPVMIVGFFLLAGMAYAERTWIANALRMAIAGAAAGIAVNIVKFIVGRARPELWLGTFHHVHGSASSFPSGHTVGAFALAGVLILGARSIWLRVSAGLLAVAVAVSRVLAFRHWTSDVVASAAIGMIAAAMLAGRRATLPSQRSSR